MDINTIINTLPDNGWSERCLERLPFKEDLNFTKGLLHLVDAEGRPLKAFTKETWGVTIADCYKYCNSQDVPYVFNFQTFASAFANYLLPWLTLTAQLPYETSGPWDNFLSLCLSVGSPALITYSLTLTILNRYSLQSRWQTLHQAAGSRGVQAKYNDFSKRVCEIQFLLQEAQQVPLRASQERGWLSSLIVGPKNQEWWGNLKKRLMRTRRGVTFSLVAQLLAAGLAWLFTVASAFLDSRGDRTVANQLSSGTLWLWLIPVICGWVTVGTQNAHDSIEDALRADIAYRSKEPPIADGSSLTEKTQQKGIRVRPALAVQPHRHQTSEAAFEVPSEDNLDLPRWLGADIMGDEQRVGPIFNYARVFTWWQLAQTIQSALIKTVNNIEKGYMCKPSQGHTNTVSPQWNSDGKPEENLSGDSYTTAQYCGLDINRGEILAYPKWHQITADVWKRIVVASIISLVMQWGTIGPGILIAYNTPTKGIGCISASYLVYGGLATLVWVLLTMSMIFSHAVMLRYQKEHRDAPSTDFRSRPTTSLTQAYERNTSHSVLCAFAVVTRLVGKTIAVLNALWLLTTSLLDYTGVYDRCYCRGNETSLGMAKGWVVLFKSEDDLSQYATSSWAGGVAISIMFCVAIYFFFWLGSRRSPKGE
ncbi:hypothetical protein GQ43DRAFT_13404 [Delitschia confertaspora ATCC 74209]|uniref:Uncharacterized protein n=1 Tax=Delitschia confertaspora ATCC 74209 TaxID=1513339 RepID=A0A9P4JSY4_9PLEO|nr:hypothetical protein GQ43DRAFT_13404 [Delitschia confertaspora ATCC 74209]